MFLNWMCTECLTKFPNWLNFMDVDDSHVNFHSRIAPKMTMFIDTIYNNKRTTSSQNHCRTSTLIWLHDHRTKHLTGRIHVTINIWLKQSIRDQMATGLSRLRELEAEVQNIPHLKVNIWYSCVFTGNYWYITVLLQ